MFHIYVIAGVPVMQHTALSRPEEDHTLDSVDTGQHLRQRRALWAAFPLHLQSAHPRSQPARSGQTEDRDALLLQRWIHRLLHWRWVQNWKRQMVSFQSSQPLNISFSNSLSASLQANDWWPSLKPILLHVCLLFIRTSFLASSNFSPLCPVKVKVIYQLS